MTLIFHKLTKWILLVILFYAGPLWASIGNVDKLEGKGVIDRNKTDITLEQELPIEQYDTVKTGNGKVGILFIDDTRVDVTQHSKLIIDEFVYDPKTNDGKFVSNIKSGTVKVITGEISKKNPDNLQVNVTTGTIGARGTEFVVVAESNDENKIILLGPGPNNTLGMMPGTLQVSDGLNTIEIIKPGYESILTN